MKKERLIKRMVIALGLSTAIIAGSVAVGTAIEARRNVFRFEKTIDRLNEEVSSIVEEKNNFLDEYESSSYYQERYNTKKKSLISDLIDNKITGIGYENEFNYLNSNKFTQDVLKNSTEQEKMDKIEELDKDIANIHDKINYVKDNREEYVAKKAIVVGLSGTMAAMLPYTMFMAYCIKGSGNKKEREKEDLTV